MYKFPKILTIFFVCLIIIQTGAFLFVNLSTEASRAADSIKFKPQVEIPGFPSQTFTKDSGTKPIGDYIKAIYKYAIGIVGILAAVMLMVGGVVWLTAGGSADRIGKAKEYITASLTGLILALCSFMILSTINPALVDFRITNIEQVKKTTGKGCCQWNDGCENNYTKNECEAEGSGGQKKGGNWNENFTCKKGKCIEKEKEKGCCLCVFLMGTGAKRCVPGVENENACKTECGRETGATVGGYNPNVLCSEWNLCK